MKNLGFPLLALNLALVGCATNPKPAPADTAPGVSPVAASPVIPTLEKLAGRQWMVIEIMGEAVAPAVEGWEAQSLEFNEDGQRVAGNGGVNRFGGRYDQKGNDLSFGPLAMTLRAGPEAQMNLEARYTKALSRVTHWRQDGRHVVLSDDAGSRLVLLEPVAKKN